MPYRDEPEPVPAPGPVKPQEQQDTASLWVPTQTPHVWRNVQTGQLETRDPRNGQPPEPPVVCADDQFDSFLPGALGVET